MKFHNIIFIISVLTISIVACRKDSNYKIKRNHRQSVGDSANHLLSNDKYKKLVVEIQYMEGFEPTAAAIDNLEDFLDDRLNKPDGIRIITKEIPAEGQSSYDLDDIKRLEDDYRKEFTTRKEIATYFLFLDGEYAGNTSSGKVLGIAYYNTSMVIFEKTLKDASTGIGAPDRTKIETTVINHEYGHILGLVNNGTDMQNDHHDEPNGAHCDNSNCLMNWTAETGDLFNNLIGSTPIPTLDANCINDLRGNGGK